MAALLTVAAPLSAANGITWNSIGLPASGFAGETINFPASVTNSGDLAWGPAYYLELADVNGTHLNYPSINGVAVGAMSPASPSVTFTLTLPSVPGTYTYVFKAVQNGIEYFGPTQTRTISVTPAPTLPMSSLTFDTTTVASGNTAIATSTAGVAGETIYHGLEGRPTGGTWQNWMIWDGTGGATQTAPVGPAAPGTYEVRAYAARVNQAGFYSNVVTLTVTTNTAIVTTHSVATPSFTLGDGTAIRSTAGPAGQMVYHGIEISRNGGAWQNWGVWNDPGGLEQTKYRTPTTSGSYVIRAYAARANMASNYSTPSTITVATTGPLVWGNILQHFGQIESTEDQDEFGDGNGNYSSSSETQVFYLTSSGTLNVYTTGDTDTRGGVVNVTNFSVNASADEGSGAGGGNFGVTIPNAGPGTYHVWVGGQEGTTSGNYTLNVDFKPDDETLALPTTVLAKPQALAPTAANSGGFTANWNGVPGVATFRLDVATDDLFSATSMLPAWNNRDVSNTLSYIVAGLTSGATYFYRVRAINTIGLASASSDAISAAPLAAPPVQPTLTATSAITSTGFTANWGALSGVVGFEIQVSRRSDFATLVGGWAGVSAGGPTATSVAVTGLLPGTVYYYRIRAVNAVGPGPFSTATVTTGGTPGGSGPSINPGAGLLEDYFLDMNLTEFWGTNAVGTVGFSDENESDGHYSLRYRGYVLPRFSGPMTFTVNSDDGARLWINNQPLTDTWSSHGGEASGTIALQAGQLYPLQLEYVQDGGQRHLRLEWESGLQAREEIPGSQCYPPGSVPLPAIGGLLTGAGTYGASFSHPITASNSPGSYAATGLPAGLSIGANGLITGVPLATGEFTVIVTATNATGTSAPATVVLTIGKATPVLTVTDQTVYNQGLLFVTPAMLPSSAAAPGVGVPAPTRTVTYTAVRTSNPSQTYNPLAPSAGPADGFTAYFGPLSVTAHYPEGDSNYLSATKTVTFVNLDTTPPVFPAGVPGLERVLLAPTSFSLKWNSATDASGGPAGSTTYEISLDGGSTVFASGLVAANFIVTGRTPGATYAVTLRARDAFGNLTGWSAPVVSVTTPLTGSEPSTASQWRDLNNDGLLDEIIPGSATGATNFDYFVGAQTERTVTYGNWVVDFIYFPGFTYSMSGRFYSDSPTQTPRVAVDGIYLPSWTYEEQSFSFPVVMPVFRFVAEPGYAYNVVRSLTKTDGQVVYYPVFSPTIFNPEGSGSSIHDWPHEWSPTDYWLQSSFEAFPSALVRASFAPGGCMIGIPGMGTVAAGAKGSVAGTVVLPGGIKVSAGVGANSATGTVEFPNGAKVGVTSSGSVQTISGTLPSGYTLGADSTGNVSLKFPDGTSIAVATRDGEVTLSAPGGGSITFGKNGLKLSLPQGLPGGVNDAFDTARKVLGLGSGAPDVRTSVDNGPWTPASGGGFGTLGTGDHDVRTTTDQRPTPAPENIVSITVTILPAIVLDDPSAAGRIGDFAPDWLLTPTVQHFVTPKKTTQISDDYVTFRPSGLSASDFPENYEWQSLQNAEIVSGSPHKIRVARDVSKRAKAVLVRKSSNSVVATLWTWVVWCESLSPLLAASQISGNPGYTFGGQEWVRGATRAIKLQFEVFPKELVTMIAPNQVPSLHGSAFTKPPGALAKPAQQPKWDISRQMRILHSNPPPTTIKPPDLEGAGAHARALTALPQPSPIGGTVEILPYPLSDVEGNDDDGTDFANYIGGLDNDPYPGAVHATRFGFLAAIDGVLSSEDGPNGPAILRAAGSSGETVETTFRFREFARLEIGTGVAAKWYRVSDFMPWSRISRYSKQSQMVDGGSDVFIGP